VSGRESLAADEATNFAVSAIRGFVRPLTPARVEIAFAKTKL